MPVPTPDFAKIKRIINAHDYQSAIHDNLFDYLRYETTGLEDYDEVECAEMNTSDLLYACGYFVEEQRHEPEAGIGYDSFGNRN